MIERIYNKTVLPGKLEEEFNAAIEGLVETVVLKGSSDVYVSLNRAPTALEDTTLNDISCCPCSKYSWI